MYFYVTLTLNCNQRCTYCYGKCLDDLGKPFPLEVEEDLPTTIQYHITQLAQFLAKDPEPTIIFYGGEPTLAMDKIREIMDTIPAKAYMIQTNGLLLDRLETGYLNRLHTILVSLDGDETTTDNYRGPGTYRRVIQNLKQIERQGFNGELIARMTVDEETRLDQAVKCLLFNAEFPFTSVHWQLDAQFWQSDYQPPRIQSWFNRYNAEVRQLVEYWMDHMERTGQILRIYPLLGVMESLLKTEATKLRCGAGWTEFNIQTDGNITPCPVMAGMKAYYVGNIWETDPKSLADVTALKEPCPRCSILHLCGGRCLYANATRLWGEEGYRLVCDTVRNLIEATQGVFPRVRKMLDQEILHIEDFEYTKYNSCEIIP